MECQFLSHWYDLTPEKSRRKRDSNPGSSALVADALTTRPARRSDKGKRAECSEELLSMSPGVVFVTGLSPNSLHTDLCNSAESRSNYSIGVYVSGIAQCRISPRACLARLECSLLCNAVCIDMWCFTALRLCLSVSVCVSVSGGGGGETGESDREHRGFILPAVVYT